MSNKLIILLVFLFTCRGLSHARDNTQVTFEPTGYVHICHLVEGESPWKTLNFAPMVNPKTMELERMFSLLIGEWRQPEKWRFNEGPRKGEIIPSHSIHVNLYPVNDLMVSSLDLSDLELDIKTSFVGAFWNLIKAEAYAVFISNSDNVVVYFRRRPNSEVKISHKIENYELFYYQCEYPNPTFNPNMWLENERFGPVVKELVESNQ